MTSSLGGGGNWSFLVRSMPVSSTLVEEVAIEADTHWKNLAILSASVLLRRTTESDICFKT